MKFTSKPHGCKPHLLTRFQDVIPFIRINSGYSLGANPCVYTGQTHRRSAPTIFILHPMAAARVQRTDNDPGPVEMPGLVVFLHEPVLWYLRALFP